MDSSSSHAGPFAVPASLPAPTADIALDANSREACRRIAGFRPHVLVVDDENLIADSVATILNRNGYDAAARYGALEAIHYVKEWGPDIVISDVILPGLDGVRLAMALRALCPAVRIILFSGNADAAPQLEMASNDGVSFEMLIKPVHPSQLLKMLKAETSA